MSNGYRPTGLSYVIIIADIFHLGWYYYYFLVNGHDRTILVILANYCTRIPDDGSSLILNVSGHF